VTSRYRFRPISVTSDLRGRSGIEVLPIGNLTRKLVKRRYRCRKMAAHPFWAPSFTSSSLHENIPIIPA